MSKQEVETVAQLAAHLSRIIAQQLPELPAKVGDRTAKDDAMKLQQLSRRAARNRERYFAEKISFRASVTECLRIGEAAVKVLKPYKLTAEVGTQAQSFRIMGLPGSDDGFLI